MNKDTHHFKAGEPIITRGDAASCAYVVMSGRAHVYLEKGDKTVTLAYLEPGDIFGETALFGNQSYGANVEAAEDTVVNVITPESFQTRLEACDPLLRSIITTLIERQRKTNEALLNSETRDFMEVAFI